MTIQIQAPERRRLLAANLIDVNPNTTDSFPARFVDVNGTLFFAAKNAAVGQELWKSDGTASGTVMMKDILPGPQSSQLDELTSSNGLLFFAANDGVHGKELWTSDGTPAGTRMVKDINPYENSWPRVITAGDHVVYFQEAEGLYVSDGTAAGTRLLVTLERAIGSITLIGSSVYFTVQTDDSGLHYNLWRMNRDGTAAGVLQEPVDNAPVQFNDRAYFVTEDNRLMSSSATGPAELVATLGTNSGSFQRALGVVNGQLILTAVADSRGGLSLWRSNGTAAGTQQLAAVPGQRVLEAIVVGTHLYYALSNNRTPGTIGTTLWQTDATPGGTSLVGTLNTDNFFLSELAQKDGLLYFVAHVRDSTSNTWTLWRTNGTPRGTIAISEVYRADPAFVSSLTPMYLTRFGDQLVYSSSRVSSGGFEPWLSDGTKTGTHRLDDVNLDGAGSDPWVIGTINGKTVFSADDGLHGTRGRYVWVTDGTPAGTQILHPITPVPRFALPADAGHGVVLNGELYFTAEDSEHGGELWKTDGTPEGTRLVGDVIDGPGGSYPESLVRLGDRIYFGSYNGMWSTDGTDAGTHQLQFAAGKAPVNPGPAVVVGDRFFFTDYTPSGGTRLWVSDGTDGGTVPVTKIAPHELTDLNDSVLLFTAYNGGEGDSLWTSDGTEAGTIPIAGGPTGCSQLRRVGDLVYFVSGHDLWKTDGTATGTVQITHQGNIDAPSYQEDGEMVVAGAKLFFTATDAKGNELWTSDGTAAGTAMVKDIRAGAVGSQPHDLIALGKRVYFAADDGVHGAELWTSDGTPQGTTLVQDLETGPGDSEPGWFFGSDGILAFSAATTSAGRELWVLRQRAAPAASVRLARNASLTAQAFDPAAPLPHAVDMLNDLVGDDSMRASLLWG